MESSSFNLAFHAKIYKELENILADYECDIARGLGSSSSSSEGEGIGISSGHSHISILTCFRNGKWMKVPVLLLVEGDIIALMGGGEAFSLGYMYCD